MKKILFTLLLILISQKSLSQNDEFTYVASATDGTEVYVLYERDNYGTKEFWVKMVKPVKTVKNKKGKFIKSGGGYTLAFFKMDCSTKTYSTSDGVEYNRNGQVVNRSFIDVYDEKVIPGSVLSAVYKFVCE
jgi:hypothetical protein